MPVSVDQKVVQMQFDNAQFEKGVQETLNSLNRLQASVEANTNEISSNSFSGLTRGLENAESSVHKMGSAVDILRDKFSVFGTVADQITRNITTKLGNIVVETTKTITGINGAVDGFSKFNQKTSAVATLMTATGANIKDVTKTLSELQWFTDQTSYNFTDMIDTMSKMSASGEKDINKLLRFTEGFALAAAKAGVGAQTTSRAMAQLTQAASRGYIQYEDWKEALGTTNIATDDLKKRMIAAGGEAAKAAGAYKDFNSSLKKGWLTIGVFSNVMDQFTQGVNSANYSLDEGGFIHSMDGAADSTTAFSEEAFNAAMECRTWSDVVDAVKDSIGSGWSNSFEAVLGDANEVRALFTGIANLAIEISDKFTSARNTLLSGWKELGGREDLLHSLVNTLNAAYRIVKPITQAMADVFGGPTPENLKSMTGSLESFTKSLSISHERMMEIYDTAKTVFTVIKNLLGLVKKFWGPIRSIILVIGILHSIRTLLGGGLGLNKVFALIKLIIAFSILKRLGGVQKAGEGIKTVISKVVQVLQNAFNKVKNIFSIIGKSNVWQIIIKALKTIGTVALGILGLIIKGVTAAINKIKTIDFSKVTNFFLTIWDVLKGFFNFLAQKITGIKDFSINSFSDVITVFKALFEKIGGHAKKFLGLFNKFNGLDRILKKLPGLNASTDKFATSMIGAANASERTVGVMGSLSSHFKALKGYIDSAKAAGKGWAEIVSKFASKINWDAVFNAAAIFAYVFELYKANKAISSLAGSIGKISGSIGGSVKKIAKSVSGTFDSISGYFKQLTKGNYGKTFKDIAIGIALIAGSLMLLSSPLIDFDRLQNAVIIVGLIAVALGGTAYVLTKLSKSVDIKGIYALAIAFVVFSGVLLEASVTLAIITAIFNHFVKTSKSFGEAIGKLYAPLGALALLMGIVVGVMAGIAFLSPLLSKASKAILLLGASFIVFSAGLTGVSISLLFFAGSLSVINAQIKKFSDKFVTFISQVKSVGDKLGVWNALMKRLNLEGKDTKALIINLAAALGSLIAVCLVARVIARTLTIVALNMALTFITLSVSLLAIAGAVVILGKYSGDFLNDATALMLGLVGLYVLLEMLSSVAVSSAAANINLVASAMLKISISILVLIGALALLQKLSMNDATSLFYAFGTLAGMLLTLAGAVRILNKAEVGKVAAALLGLTVSLYLLIPIVALLSINAAVIWKGIGLLSGFMLALAFSTKIMNDAKPGRVVSILVTYGVVVTLLSRILMQISALPFEQVAPAVGLMVGMMIGLSWAIRIIVNSTKGLGKVNGFTKILAMVASMAAMCAAINVLSDSVMKIAKLPIDQMIAAVGSIVVLMAVFKVVVTKMMEAASIAKSGKAGMQKMLETVAICATVAISMVALALAASQLAKQPIANIAVAVGSMAGLMIMLEKVTLVMIKTAAATKLGKSAGEQVISMVIMMLSVTASIGVLAQVLQSLATIPANKILSSLGALAAISGLLTGAIVAIMAVSKIANPSALLAVSLTMVAFTASVSILAIGMTALAALEGKLGPALMVVGVFGLIITTLSLVSSVANPSSLLAMSVAMIAFGTAITIMAAGFNMLAAVPIAAILSTIISFGAVMVALSALSIVANPMTLLAMSAAMLAFGAAVTIMAVGLNMLAEVPIATILSTLITFGAILTVLSALSIVANPMTLLAMSVAMVALGTGILVMAAGLSILSEVPIGTVILGLVGFTAALIALVVVMSLIPGASAAMLSFGGAVALVGVGVLAACAGLAALTFAITGLLPVISQFLSVIVSLSSYSDGMMNMAGVIAVLGVALIPFAIGLGLASAAGLLCAAAVAALAAAFMLMNRTLMTLPAAIKAVKSAMGSLGETLAKAQEWMDHFTQNLGTSLKDGAANVCEGAAEVAHNIASYLHFSSGPENGELSTWSEWMPHLTQQLGDLLYSSAGNVKKGAAEVGSKIKDGIADPMKDLGDALCDNVDLSGLSAMLGEAGTDIGNLFGGNLYSTGSSWISKLTNLGGKKTGGHWEQHLNQAPTWVKDPPPKFADDWLPDDFFDPKPDNTPPTKPLDDFGGGLDDVSKKAGGASKSTEDLNEKLKKLRIYAKYSEETIKALSNSLGGWSYAISNNVNVTEGAKTVFSQLAEQIYQDSLKANDEIEDTSMTAEERLEAVQNAFSEAFKTIKDNIDGALDLFSEFNTGLSEAISPEKMLSNAKSQAEGIKSFYQRVQMLAFKGFGKEVIDAIIEEGPSAYAKVSSMLKMTADQVSEYNKIWAGREELVMTSAAQAMVAKANVIIFKGLKERVAAEGAGQEAIMKEANAYQEMKKSGKASSEELQAQLKKVEDACTAAGTTMEKFIHKNQVSTVELTDDVKEQTKAYCELKNSGTASAEELQEALTKLNDTAVNNGLTVDELINKVYDIRDASAESVLEMIDHQEELYSRLVRFEDLGDLIGSNVASSLESAFDPFGEWKDDFELTSEQLVERVQKTVSGMHQYYDQMVQIANNGGGELIAYFGDKLTPEVVNALSGVGSSSLQAMADSLIGVQQLIDSAQATVKQSWMDHGKLDGQTYQQTLQEYLAGSQSMATLAQQMGMNLSTAVQPVMTQTGMDSATIYTDALTEGFAENQEAVEADGYNNASLLTQSMANGIQEQSGTVSAAGSDLSMAVDTAVKNTLTTENGSSIGMNWVQGIINGIDAKKQAAVDAARALAQAISETTSGTLQIGSPSKLSYKFGRWWDMGAANGLDSASGYVENASESVSNTIVDTMRTALQEANDILSGDVSTQPVITPIINLDNAKAGIRSLGASFNSSAFRVNASLGKINTPSDRLADIESRLNSPETPGSNQYQFIQNNYSPKALSKIDIYRQTKSQFAQFRGQVNSK